MSIGKRPPLNSVIAISCALLLIAGCKPEEAQKNGISGTVQVEGSSAAGTKVRLYREPNFDDSYVWYETAQTPEVGFPYNPAAAFEWRSDRQDSVLIDSVIVGEDGQFNFGDLSDDDYVIIAQKAGFGWTAPRKIQLRGDATDAGSFLLYPETEIQRVPFTTNITFEAGHHYVLQSDLIVDYGGSLTLEPGAVVRAPYNGRIIIRGAITAIGTEDEYVTFTSNEAVPTFDDWEECLIDSGVSTPPVFRYCRVEYCADGLRIGAHGGTVEYCYFSRCAAQAVDFNGYLMGQPRIVNRCVFEVIPLGVRVYQAPEIQIDHNIFWSCRYYAVNLQRIRGGQAWCNLFNDCGRFDTSGAEQTGAYFLSDVRDTRIHHNKFTRSSYTIDLGSNVDSSTIIERNHFQGIARVMNVRVTEEQLGPSYPVFRFNCMISIDRWHIQQHSCHINRHDIDCRNNFWNTADPDLIRDRMILDCSDHPEFPSFVLFEPILTSCPTDAGLCPN